MDKIPIEDCLVLSTPFFPFVRKRNRTKKISIIVCLTSFESELGRKQQVLMIVTILHVDVGTDHNVYGLVTENIASHITVVNSN